MHICVHTHTHTHTHIHTHTLQVQEAVIRPIPHIKGPASPGVVQRCPLDVFFAGFVCGNAKVVMTAT